MIDLSKLSSLEIKTKQALIRPLFLEDVSTDYVDWLNNKEVNRFLESRFMVHSLQSCKEYVLSMLDSKEDFLYGIFDKENEFHIGNIKLSKVSLKHLNAEMGILIGNSNYWGRGIACEVIKSVTSFSFNCGLNRINAGVYDGNYGSIKAFEKAGYLREATLRDNRLLEDGFVDEFIYGILNNLKES